MVFILLLVGYLHVQIQRIGRVALQIIYFAPKRQMSYLMILCNLEEMGKILNLID